ncbi:hypothetical protein D3C71_345400 [compost metagenome]
MRFVVFTMLALVVFSCTKKETKPSISLEGTSWNWISTTKDSTFYEDTASSANNQFLTFTDFKNFDWKRNDTAFASGIYLYGMQQSVLLGKKKFIVSFAGVQTPFIMTRNIDTLWLQEDKANGGVRFRFLKH